MTEATEFREELNTFVGACCASALSSFQSMTGRDGVVQGELSILRATGLQTLADLERPSVVTRLNVQGDGLAFRFFCIFSESSAAEVVARLLGSNSSSAGLTELEESAIGELVNIQGSAFLEAAAKRLRLALLPSPPLTFTGQANKVLNTDLERARDTAVLTVRFEAPRAGFDGRFLLALDNDNFSRLFERLGLRARDAERVFDQ